MKMRYTNRFLTLAAILLVSCTAERLNDPSVPDAGQKVSEKICNTSENAEEGVLIAKFCNEAIPYLEQTASMTTKSGAPATRSGIASVDEILAGLEVTSLERVFPKTEKFEANTRAAGLHRWYRVGFDKSQNLDEAASMLAQVAEISTIQFNKKVEKCFAGEAVPFDGDIPGPVTRSSLIVESDFNDPQISWQWHYINNADQAVSSTARRGIDINVVNAWKLTDGDPHVIVAVIDEGVKYTHPDLAANMWTNESPTMEAPYNGQDIHGWNFADNGPITWDKETTNNFGQKETDSGHGTHVAGTVAAVNNNATGVAGVAGGDGTPDSGVKIMSCQVFSAGASSTDQSVSSAIKYAADHGAAIIQCSYGFNRTDLESERDYMQTAPLEREALDYFMNPAGTAGGGNTCTIFSDGGGIAIYAAGNENLSRSNFPGGYHDCISVTAVGPDGLPAYYTNYGPGCNIAAPGGETTGHSGAEKAGVLSTLVSEVNGSDYGYMQGTSMACPHVSGVAALGLSYAYENNIKIDKETFKSMLLTSVNDIDSRLEGNKGTMNLDNYKGKMGIGLIDAYQLLMQLKGTPCLKISTDKVETITLTQYFGGSAADLTYTGVEMVDEFGQPDDDVLVNLGMPTRPVMENGQLRIKCTKPGVGHIKVTAIAGGNRPGSEAILGGMEVTKEFAVIVRDNGASNGGWL